MPVQESWRLQVEGQFDASWNDIEVELWQSSILLVTTQLSSWARRTLSWSILRPGVVSPPSITEQQVIDGDDGTHRPWRESVKLTPLLHVADLGTIYLELCRCVVTSYVITCLTLKQILS